VTVDEIIDYLGEESTFFAIIDGLDRITDGCRRRISPEEELVYSYMYLESAKFSR
jgi:hypothetical protein